MYGLGGTGKTALGDAVYWSLYHEKVLPFSNHEEVRESKYSYVRLFEFINSVPKIPKLQIQVLQDLTSRTADIRRDDVGRDAIKEVLEKEVVFIYIDNVLFPDKVEKGLDAIERLLPRTGKNVKKLRLHRIKAQRSKRARSSELKQSYILLKPSKILRQCSLSRKN